MTSTQRKSWISALQRIKSSGQYDALTKTHQTGMLGDANEWHRRPILLPVHRWFLSQLEAATGQPTPYCDLNRHHATRYDVGKTATRNTAKTKSPQITVCRA